MSAGTLPVVDAACTHHQSSTPEQLHATRPTGVHTAHTGSSQVGQGKTHVHNASLASFCRLLSITVDLQAAEYHRPEMLASRQQQD